MAVVPEQDAGPRPAGADAAHEAAQMAAHREARGRLAWAKDDGDRTAPVGVVDVDRQKNTLIVVRIVQRQLLLPMDDVASTVDVECHRARWLRVGADPASTSG